MTMDKSSETLNSLSTYGFYGLEAEDMMDIGKSLEFSARKNLEEEKNEEKDGDNK